MFACEGEFLWPHDIEVDFGAGELGVPHPTFQQSKRHAGLQRADAEGVTEAVGAGLDSGDAGLCHDFLDDAPACCAMKIPQTRVCVLRRPLALPEIEDRIEVSDEGRRKWHVTPDRCSSLEREKHYTVQLKIEACGRESENLTDATA